MSKNLLINHENEQLALANVINKLNIYMDKSKLTLHGLASSMGFSYQPFYRLVTKKHMPTASSLGLIARHLNCTIAELVDDKVFVDINYYLNENADFNQDNCLKCRVYIPYEEYLPYIQQNFFALKYKDKMAGAHTYRLFHTVAGFNMDGIFLVENNLERNFVNVVSVSSKFIIIEEHNHEVKVETKTLKPLAKFFKFMELKDPNNSNQLVGVKL